MVAVLIAVGGQPTDAHAIVTHRATASNVTESGGSLAITKPAGTVAGDVLIATAVQNDGSNISPPAGWTVLESDLSDAASWYRVAGASEPASYTFNAAGGGDTFAVIISAFAGADTTTPIAGSAKSSGTSASTTLPNATATRNGSMRWSSAGLSPSNNVTATYSGGMTKVGERPGNDAALSAAVESTNAGATASRTVTFSASDAWWAYTAVVNAALPVITSISPSVGPIAGGQSVTITGRHFTSASGVTFGGTAGTSVTVVNDTTITVNTPARTAGTYDVRVTTPPGTSVDAGTADNYTYADPPTVTGISPAAGPTAGGTSVTITGTNFTGATQVQFGGTNAASFTVVNDTTITATSPSGSAGVADVRVTNPGGTSPNTSADDFTFCPLPTVTGLSPASGPEAGGTSVTITGTGFTGLSGASAVQFGGTNAASYTVNSATQVTATAPAGTGMQNVRVTTPGGTSANTASDDYTYVPLPTVTSVSPNVGPTGGGTSVTITGTNFIGLSGASAVTFGGTNATSYTVNSATSITATPPAGSAGVADVRVTGTGGTSANTAADNYTYYALPTVTALSPNGGPLTAGTSVTITGTNFTGTTQVQFGGTSAVSFTVDSATQITATAPAGSAGVVDVRVTSPGGTNANTAADDYTYVPAPTVTNVSPATGPTAGATSVTITGTNFTGATQVRFGATNATGYTVNSATQITATAPAGTGTVDVRVTTGGGQSANTAADDYVYADPPVVSSISPTLGPTAGGTTVTITGSFFTGTTNVTFGGTSASFSVVNATTITATSPARAAGLADVRVTTPDGTSANTAADDFTYVPAPTVTGLSPSDGPDSGGTTVTITGANLTGATAVTFGGTAALGFTVVNATTITATAPAHAPGIVDLRVTTPGGQSANTAADDYEFLAACGGGTLDLVADDVTFTPFTLDGTDHTRVTSTTFNVADMTGTGDGWKLEIGIEQFTAGPGKTLHPSAARIASATATPLGGSCSSPTSTISSYPITLPISPSKTTIYNADVNTGRGPVDVELDVELDVPAHTMFGTYTSEWDVDLTAAP